MSDVRKVMVCFPAGLQSYSREFVESWNVAKNHLLASDLQVELAEYFCHTFPIDANRNECVSRALELGVDTTIWLDMDQTFPPDLFLKLLKPDNPIVAGVYHVKAPPFHPVVFRRHPEDDDHTVFQSIIEYPKDGTHFYADMIGMGCVKIDREVLEKLERPFFKYRVAPKSEHLGDMGWKIDNEIADVSEDVHFWKQVAEKTDYRIWIDGSLQCGHIHKVIVDHNMSASFLQAQQAQFIAQHGEDKFNETWAQVCKAEIVKKSA